MMLTDHPIGVFDSGIGGLSVLKALIEQMPSEPFVYLADSGYAPYGERGDAYVQARARACTAWLVAQGCQMVVVACNTATAAAIGGLRAEFAQLQWVGIEPALKPAVAATRSGHVAVLATRGTLESDKFAALAAQQPAHIRVSSLPCDGLADAIERQDEPVIATKIVAACAMFTQTKGQFGVKNNTQHPPGALGRSAPAVPATPAPGPHAPAMAPPDVAVLGCTHYPLALALWRAHLPAGVQIIDPAQAVARQAARLRAAASPTPAPYPTKPHATAPGTPPDPNTPTASSPDPAIQPPGHLILRFATTGPLQRLQAAVAAHISPQAATQVQSLHLPSPTSAAPQKSPSQA